MEQSLSERVAALINQAKFDCRVERVALLRGVRAILSANVWRAGRGSTTRHRHLGLELFVVGIAQPEIERVIAHRPQTLVPGRIADIGEGRERPMRTAPFRIGIDSVASESIPAVDQRLRTWRVPNFLL